MAVTEETKNFSFDEWLKNPFPVYAHQLFKDMPLWMFVEFATCLEDPVSDSGFKPFKLWDRQIELCEKLDCNSTEFEKALCIAKRRQVGGSECIAALITKILITEARAQIVVISRNEDEAEYFLTTRVKPKLKNLPQLYKDGVPLIHYPKFINLDRLYIQTDLGYEKDDRGEIQGSNVTAVASHADAASGRTLRLVVMDEAEKIEHASQIFTSVRPTIERNPRGQLVILSSGQKNGTWFKSVFLRRIYDKKIKGVGLFFIGRWSDPTATQAWWDEVKTQFDSEVDARAAYPETIEDLFLTPEGKVFPQFDERIGGRHVRHFEIGDKQDVNWTFKFITAFDPGTVHPAAFLMSLYDRFNDVLYIFDEYVKAGVVIDAIGKEINRKLSAYPLKPARNLCDTALFKRNGLGITEGDVLKKVTGMNFVGAAKTDSAGSRGLLSKRLSDAKIVIHPRCVNTIEQMRDWVYDKNGNPVDVGDDCIDDLRYICADIRPETRAIPGQKPDYYTAQRSKLRKRFKSMWDSAKSGKPFDSSSKHWLSA